MTSLVPVRAIYGNHENIEQLQSARNIDDTPILMKDGQMLTVENFRFGFINGIMAERTERLKSVPRKTSFDFVRHANSLVGVDVLCTHESPIVPSLEKRIHPSVGTTTMGQGLELVKPGISLSGHTGRGCDVSQIGSTISLIIDSSQSAKHFIVLDLPARVASIWRDTEMRENVAL